MMTVLEHFNCTFKEMPQRFGPGEMQLWIARYALKPWGGELRMLARLLGAIRKNDDWEKAYLPVECVSEIDYSDVPIEVLRKRVAQQMRSFFSG